MASLGYTLSDAEIEHAFARFKTLSDQKKSVFDDDIIALVDEENHLDAAIQFDHINVQSGSARDAWVELTLIVSGARKTASVTGNGPVDAAFKAIAMICENDARLALFSVAAVTGETDAQAKTTVQLEKNGRTVDGQGADVDYDCRRREGLCARAEQADNEGVASSADGGFA